MNKTLLVQGLTAGTVGTAATKGALDITPAILATRPELRTPTVTSTLFSTIVAMVVEGEAKFYLNRKVHINKYNKTSALHDEANAVGGKTVGAVSTVKFKQHTKDKFTFTLNKSWDAGFVYDKKKDPKVVEGKMIDDLGSLLADIKEDKAQSFWLALNADVAAAVDSLSTLHPKYVSSEDLKTKASPKLVREISIKATPTTLDEMKIAGIKIVNGMFDMVTSSASMGRKGSATSGFPYSRGTRAAIGQKFLVKESTITLISLDERFVQAGLSPEMIASGVKGLINGVAVYQDDMMDANSHHDIALLSTGNYSPVIVANEVDDAFALITHPTKPTRSNLLEGSGAYDTYVTPYVNLCRFAVIKTA